MLFLVSIPNFLSLYRYKVNLSIIKSLLTVFIYFKARFVKSVSISFGLRNHWAIVGNWCLLSEFMLWMLWINFDVFSSMFQFDSLNGLFIFPAHQFVLDFFGSASLTSRLFSYLFEIFRSEVPESFCLSLIFSDLVSNLVFQYLFFSLFIS